MNCARIGLLTLCALTIGCGGGDAEKVKVYEAGGKITMSGSPVVGAAVTFAPKDGQPLARGTTDDQGVYKLTTYGANDGAAEGNFDVLVTKDLTASTEVDNSEDDPEAEGYGEGPSAGHADEGGDATTKAEDGLNAKYASASTSGLTATVTADGENKFDFNLDP